MNYFTDCHDSYIAIIGDIKRSRDIGDRMAFQEKLKNILSDINQVYYDSLASGFTITLGDEFQGLLHSGKDLMNIIQYIKSKIYPVKVRFGIGIGRITTRINPLQSLGADGPGYYKAREGIECLKESENKKEATQSDIQIKIDGNNSLQELTLNSILKLMYAIENDWTKKRREIVNYALITKKKQLDIAYHFGVTQSNINQILSKSNFNVYKDSLDTLNKIFSEVQ